MNGTMIDLPYLSLNFPSSSQNPIDRSNYVDTIERLFSLENKVVFINGEPGVGKTQLLADFCRKNNLTAISIFTNTRDKYSYDRRNVEYDICNQLNWLLYREEIKESTIDPSYLRKNNILIRRYLRSVNKPIYFVFDGLESIPSAYLGYFDELVSDLPLAANNLYFLFSGAEKLLKPFFKHLEYSASKELIVPPFSFGETQTYLNLISNSSGEFVNDIYRMTNGYASKLESLRSLIKQGLSFLDIIEGGEGKDAFLELEWRQIEYDDPVLSKILAFLAFSETKYSLKSISSFVEIPEEDIITKIASISFVTVNKTSMTERTVEYSHDSYKNYAKKIYASKEKQVLGQMVDHYLINSDTYESIQSLNSLYERTKKWDAILSLLTPAKMNILLEKSESINTIISQTEKGIYASSQIENVESSYKYNIYKSVLLEIEKIDIWKSEIEAQINLGENESALLLAQSAFIKEDRIKLLSLIVRKLKENNKAIDASIIDDIRELYEQLDLSKLKEGAIEIATNLMYSCPDLAIRLIESTGQAMGENMMDWALAQLSLSTTKKGNEEDWAEINDAINSRIKNNEIKNIIKGIRYFGNSSQNSNILSIIRGFEKASEKLFFIRNWLKHDSKHANIVGVLEEAYDIIISTTEYVVNASVLKDLAFGLRFIDDNSMLLNIIDKYEMLKETVKQRGPTKDYVQFILNLIVAEINADYEKAICDLYEVYYYISDLQDIIIKTECLAIYLRKVIYLQEQKMSIANEGLVDEPQKALVENINLMLEKCAYHYDIFKNLISLLPKINEEYCLLAITIADRMNAHRRRDISYCDIMSAYARKSFKKLNADTLFLLFNKIAHQDNKKAIIVEIWDKIHDSNEKEISSEITERFFIEIENINDSILKSYCLVRAYAFCLRDELVFKEKIENIRRSLYHSWESIDAKWDRMEVAFKIASDLANTDRALAEEYLNYGTQEKTNTYLDSPNRAQLLIYSVKLAIRAFASLPIIQIQDEYTYKKLGDLINNIPSVRSRMELWGDLALRLINNGKHDMARRITREEIRAALNLFSRLDGNTRSETMTKIAPALYATHQSTALQDVLKYVEKDNQESVFATIIDYLLTKRQCDEKCDRGYYDKNISYEDISDCLDVLNYISLDAEIYSVIKKLADIISMEKDLLSGEQKREIKRRIGSLIDSKLPDPKNIKHDGYVLISKAQLLRMEREKYDQWQPLFDRADSLDNLSDRVFVLTVLLEELVNTRKNELTREKKIWVERILTYLEEIPSFYERLERITDFLPVLKLIDKEHCVNHLKKIFNNVNNDNEQNYDKQQQELIDFAFGISPELAESLIAKSDTDPSRNRIGARLKNHLNILKMEKSIFESEDPDEYDRDNLPKLCHSLIKAINSNKLNSRPLKDLGGFVSKISEMSFSDSYPIAVYVLENSIIRYRETNEAATILYSIYNSIIFSCEMICLLGNRATNKSYVFEGHKKPLHNVVIKKGQEEKAKSYLRDWGNQKEISRVIIIDPYFSENDLTLIKEFQEINININYLILTGIAHNKRIIENKQYEDAFRESWHRISIEKIPRMKVVFVGRESNNEPPFHDRWWLVNRGEAGLRVGTSYNSLGKNKDSEISVLSSEESMAIYSSIVVPYAENNIDDYASEKLNYRALFL